MIAINNNTESHGMQLRYQSKSGTKIKHDIIGTKSETTHVLGCLYKGIFAGAYSSNYNSAEVKVSIPHSTASQGTVTQLRGKYSSIYSYGRKLELCVFGLDM